MISIFLDNKKRKVIKNKVSKSSSITHLDESSDMLFTKLLSEDVLPKPEQIPDGDNTHQPESELLKTIKSLIPEDLGINLSLPISFMPFPDQDIENIRIKAWNITTRIGSEVGRYQKGQLILPPWGWRYITISLDGKYCAPYYVSDINKFSIGKEHPHYKEAKPKEKQFLDTLNEEYEVITIKPTHISELKEVFLPPKSKEELDEENQKDEISLYRAKNLVEVIKYEKTFDQFLICQRNWFLMTAEQKRKSSSFSTRRFGAGNIARIPQILREYKSFIDVGEFAERYQSTKNLINL